MLYDIYESNQTEYSQGFKKVLIKTNKKVYTKQGYRVYKKEWGRNCTLFFDEDGKIIQSIEFDPDYNLKSKVFYAYDNDWQLSSIIKINPIQFPAVEVSNLLYNEDGNVKSETYNAFSKESAVCERKIYENYYERNKVTVKTNFFEDYLEEDESFFIIYDNDKRVLEEKCTKGLVGILWWDKFEYDDENKIVKKYSLDQNGEVERFYEEQTIKTEESITKKTITENGIKNKVMEIIKNKKGDWLEKRIFIDDVLHHTIKRIIEYY